MREPSEHDTLNELIVYFSPMLCSVIKNRIEDLVYRNRGTAYTASVIGKGMYKNLPLESLRFSAFITLGTSQFVYYEY